jgi:hypothetical protein
MLSVLPSILTQEPSELVLVEREWSGSPVRVMASYLPAISNRHDLSLLGLNHGVQRRILVV